MSNTVNAPSRRSAVVVLAVAGITVAGLGGVLVSRAGSGSAGEPHIGVLERAATPRDELPATAAAHVTRDGRSRPETARLALDQDGKQLFVVRGAHGTACLVLVHDDQTASTCGRISGLATDAIYMAMPRPSRATMDVVGVVRDGVSVAEAEGHSAKVVNNVFALENVPETRYVHFSGPSAQFDLDLGRLAPPTVTTSP